jgi:hypothetical protein
MCNFGFCVVVVDMSNQASEYVFDVFDTVEQAFACVNELEQFYDLFFDMYSDLEFVVRDYKGDCYVGYCNM